MSDPVPAVSGLDHLAQDLVADLRPVKRLRSPWLRAAAWLAVVSVVGGILAMDANVAAVAHRLAATSDMWLAVTGSSLTAVLAVIATFQLALPDRNPGWALLPLPAMVVWIAASGLGCARAWLIYGTYSPSMGQSTDCLIFILGLSLPFSVLLVVMLRRSYTMYPVLTGVMAGLAAAAAAATLLNFFHPFDATVSDLAVHAATVAFVIGLNRVMGGALLRRRLQRPPRKQTLQTSDI